MPRNQNDDDESSYDSREDEQFSDEGSDSEEDSDEEDSDEYSDDEEQAERRNSTFSSSLYDTQPHVVPWRDSSKASQQVLGLADENNSHSQLPSPEEAKSTNVRQRNSRRRDPIFYIVIYTIIAMIAVFVMCFFLFPEWYYGGKDKNDDAAPTNPPVMAPTNPPGANMTEVIDSQVRDIIAMQQGLEFEDPTSYQSRALDFMVSRASLYESHSTERLRQVYALLCLFYRTNDNNFGGQSWRETFVWLKGNNECAWTGVKCNFLSLVTRIDLTNAVMVAMALPPELELLSASLEDLILDDNPELSGAVPSFLGDMHLETLSLENCGFSGDLPVEICNHAKENLNFVLEVDCDQVFCEQTCCDSCY